MIDRSIDCPVDYDRKSRENKTIKHSPKREIKKKEKIIDSISDDEDELEINLDISSKYIIYPDSNFKLLWEIVIDIVMAYLLISIPLGICYGINDNVKFINYLAEIIFFLDIIINFFVAYYNYDESLVLNHSMILYHYLFGWFFIDFISALPTCYIMNNLINYNHFTKKNTLCFTDAFLSILTLLKFIKLIKLFSSQQLKNKLYQEFFERHFHFQSGEERVLWFFIWFLIASHNLACMWIFFGKFDSTNWFMYVKEDDDFDIYVASLYFNWTTIFTIGYGDILSVSIYERIYNIFLMTFGVCIYSFAVTSLSNLIISQDSHTKKFMNYLAIIDDIRDKYPNIPMDLNQSLTKFVRYDYKSNKSEKYSFIWDLPNKIRNILIIKMFQTFLKNFSFFRNIKKNKSDDFDTKILLYMRPVKIPKGEFLIKQNSRVEELIFINQGILSVELGEEYDRKKVFQLRKYDHFGDLFVLTNKKCPVNLRVKSKYCEILIIKKNDLLEIAKDYPDTINEILKTSMKNYKRMKTRVQKMIEKHESILKYELKLNEKTHIDTKLVKETKQEKKEENTETTGNLKIITEMNESEDSEENNFMDLTSNIRLMHNKGINQIEKELKIKVHDKKEEQKMILSNENSEESFSENNSTQDINYISKNMSENEIRSLIRRRINSSSKIFDKNSITKEEYKIISPEKSKPLQSGEIKQNHSLKENKMNNMKMSLFFDSFQKSSNAFRANELFKQTQIPFLEFGGGRKVDIKENHNMNVHTNDSKNSIFTRKSFKRNSDGNIRIERIYKDRGSLNLDRLYSKTIITKRKKKSQISLIPKNMENSINLGIPQNITTHMQESRDPNSFLLREISKIEKKLLVDKKKELQVYNKKLDYILNLLLGSKK